MRLYSLLYEAHNGDKESIVIVFLRFHPTIKKFSKNLNYEEAETDLTIALLELIKYIDINGFSNDDGQVVNYIYKFLKNKSIDLFRKHVLGYKPSLELNFDILPDDNIIDLDNKVFISILLDSLPIIQREVIKRKYIQGFSDNEISNLFGVSRQAVNRAKNKGLNNLRKALEKNGGGQNGRKDI